ncbi:MULTISPECIES: 30S ribosomal protein S20 [unclassified Oceanispirochaeta]|uniref:30S ribosomal protein S20 n=1 Tax=unclassified Oceanispirochaeta TaxID=2635722 RepID=UPI000E08E444|nr:30S ribosomal protein S20 [Oceanispirochaeta sp. M1]MBF9015772.1 30S ribosomal protein S20 [Oceanispirochaeta sp. M2]NPD72235.1 30S ribosomal protein S20 [Oceanispirochaeta sp. M1]RDG32332.1 30S ribosomal protein S20 [Oceanispirochaeta sp. M1]
MPNSLDAAKRHRQNLKARAHNRTIRSTVRTSVKAFEMAVEAKDKAKAEVTYAQFVKLIDTATGKGLYHKNMTARKKSRLHKALAAMA